MVLTESQHEDKARRFIFRVSILDPEILLQLLCIFLFYYMTDENGIIFALMYVGAAK